MGEQSACRSSYIVYHYYVSNNIIKRKKTYTCSTSNNNSASIEYREAVLSLRFLHHFGVYENNSVITVTSELCCVVLVK